jgi:hypothetical protein
MNPIQRLINETTHMDELLAAPIPDFAAIRQALANVQRYAGEVLHSYVPRGEVETETYHLMSA